MLKRLEMTNVGPARALTLDFAPRVNLLTGDNGLGKSFVLDVAWWALTGTESSHAILPRSDASERSTLSMTDGDSSQDWRADFEFHPASWGWGAPTQQNYIAPPRQPRSLASPVGPRRAGALVVHLHADGGFGIWDAVRNRQEESGERGRIVRPASYLFDRRSLWFGLAHDGVTVSNGLLRDMVSWQQRDSDEHRALTAALAGLSVDREALKVASPVRLSPTDVMDYPAIELPYGIVPLTHASSGVQNIVSLAYALVWTVFEHRRATALMGQPSVGELVVMIDEVEAHLHPRWQRAILPALLRVVAALVPKMAVQLLVVTHSPLVLASMEGEFDDARDALFDFDLAEGRRDVEVRRLDWRPRGNANAWLTSEVFDLKQPGGVRAEEAIEKAKAALRDPGLSITAVREIHRELHAVLRDTDPFWARWEARARAAGIDP